LEDNCDFTILEQNGKSRQGGGFGHSLGEIWWSVEGSNVVWGKNESVVEGLTFESEEVRIGKEKEWMMSWMTKKARFHVIMKHYFGGVFGGL